MQSNSKCEPTQTPDDIDIPALREKYRQERDKRIRPEGSKQYAVAEGDLAVFDEVDPYSPPVHRDSISEDTDVAVLGGGFAGLICSARLKEAGISDIRIVEQGGDFGGTWYWNRYPGIQCDNDAYCYVPLLEELSYVPTQKYADGPEIFEHCQRIGKHFGLYESTLFGTLVRSLRWDAAIQRWRIDTNQGDEIRARFVIMASGFAHRPKLPGVPGIRSFKGHSFHSARWDYEYTGGSPIDSQLHKLADKRVGIVGTGDSAIKIVPYLGRYAEHVYVFQRTPSSVDARGNTPTDPEWAKSLKSGWQKERQANFHGWSPLGFAGYVPGLQDAVCDFWTEIGRNVAAKLEARGNPQLTPEQLGELLEDEDYRVMERLRRRVDSIVEDGATAEALKPWFRFLCKRPLSNDDYLATFNRPNVTLVDVSESKGVEAVTPKGVVAEGDEYELDCIIYASGFEVTTEISRRYSMETIEGRDGLSLFDHWAEGYKTLHGMTSHGFPNQFFTGFSQGAVSANTTSMYEQQAEHIVYIIREALARGIASVEASKEAQDEWCRTIRENTFIDPQYAEECTPGYYNNEGGGGGEGIRSNLGEPYGPGFYAFDELLREWREKGDLAGLVLED